jgi:two-component system, sensor histidine kinase and response regulator
MIPSDMTWTQLLTIHQQMQKDLVSLGREKEQLQELLRLREEFEALVVHDLRNPLNAIIVALNLLDGMKDQITPPEPFLRATELAKNATRRMTQLISTLLDVARLEAGKLVLNISEFDLSALIKDEIEMQKITATETVKVVPHTLPGLMIKADRDVLGRVVANLLDNAMKFSPPESTIEITAQSLDNQAIRIDVIDAGPGVPLEERERIFEKFAQVNDEEHENRCGTGLGLTFCRMAVEAHGGCIRVDDKPSGTGSCFSIQIPKE